MITVKFYLKNPTIKGKLRSDEVSILAKITLTKLNRFEVRTGEKIEPRFWDKKNQQVKSTYRDHYDINEVLLQFKSRITKLYRDNQHLSFGRFKQLAQEKPNTEKKTLFLALEQFIESYKSEKDIKTVAKYLTLQRHLIEFDKQYPIDFPTLDFRFYDSFKEYLAAIPNPFYANHTLVHKDGIWDIVPGKGETIGIFDEQIYAYFKQLKTFISWAEKRDYKVNSSYKKWQIIRRQYEPISLTFDELERLENFQFTTASVKPFVKEHKDVATYERNLLNFVKSIDIARDYLVFECRTGQRISDIKRFNYKDFSDNSWTFIPRKGRRLSSKSQTVYFDGYCAPALFILQKHNFKMPPLSEQKINDSIKTACKVVGIDTPMEIFRWAQNKCIRISGPRYEYISTHIGRKTFVTIGLQFMSAKVVKDLARMSWKTLAHYEGTAEKSTIKQALESVQMRRVK